MKFLFMKFITKIFLFPAFLLLSLSCEKESVKEAWTKQEKDIEKYIENEIKSNPAYKSINDRGSSRLITKEGAGEALSPNGTISFYYAAYIFPNSSISLQNLFSTNKESVALAAQWSLSDENAWKIKTINLSESNLVAGLKNGLTGVKGGEECVILFSGKYGFGNNSLGTIPANSALAYQIWVESISNE